MDLRGRYLGQNVEISRAHSAKAIIEEGFIHSSYGPGSFVTNHEIHKEIARLVGNILHQLGPDEIHVGLAGIRSYSEVIDDSIG